MGQNEPFPCATDQVNSALFHEHPELQPGIINATQELEQFTQHYIQQTHQEKSGNPYIIPVVFHVIHDYGEGNISSSQIHDAVRQVNLQYRKNNLDTTDIINDFKSLASDTEIEIRLAQLDPDGNCTSGITRTYSPLTNIGDHQVKDLIHWPPDKYLNVYVCNNAAGLAGHSLMPGTADTIPEWDGIVMQHSYLGSIGTSNHFRRTVLSHEIGHFLNLQHIWGGNNVPTFYYLPVASSGNCTYDDGVADTPLTIGWQTCNLSGTSCGSLDMVQNYMDYSYCSLLFTEGQKQRMHAALNSTVANRSNLWSTPNLIATGVDGNTNHLCNTEIVTSQNVICSGESVTFSDLSVHGVTSRDWTFQGGDITSSSDSLVTVTYTQPGEYDVSLSVSNGINTIDTLMTAFIQVLDDQPAVTNILENFENILAFENQWYPIMSSNPIGFERINYGKNSDSSIYVDNFNGPEEAEYTLESKPFDASQYSDFAITFDYSYAEMTTSTYEKIQIQLSKDCGKTWQTKRVISLNNTGSIESDNEFFPEHDSLWTPIEKNFPIGNYNTNDLMVRFLFTANNGNNLFIDNINISDISELSIHDEPVKKELKIYPNPASDILTITQEQGSLTGQIQLLDVLGKCVYKESVTKQKETTISLSPFTEGTYFLRYMIENSKSNYAIQKVVITR
jgi:PKD repeat protein